MNFIEISIYFQTTSEINTSFFYLYNYIFQG